MKCKNCFYYNDLYNNEVGFCVLDEVNVDGNISFDCEDYCDKEETDGGEI